MRRTITRLAVTALLAAPLVVAAAPAQAGTSCFLGYCWNNAPRSKGGDCTGLILSCDGTTNVRDKPPKRYHVPSSKEWKIPKNPKGWDQEFGQKESKSGMCPDGHPRMFGVC
jgi:hypothetical protein